MPNSTSSSSPLRSPLSVWDLPTLLTPMHSYKRSTIDNPKERPHYLPVLTFVYRNRFAIAEQIRRRFSHILKSGRTTRRHLVEMESLGWVDVVPTRGTSPLWPKTYYCTARGARKLRESLAAKGKPGHIIRVDRRRREGYSVDHVLHEVLTTEFMLMVWESMRASDDLELLRIERRSIPSQPAFKVALRSKMTRLEPDALFLYRERNCGMMCCFVEIDTGSMTRQQLKAKFYRYEKWSQAECGRQFLLDLYRRNGAQEPKAAFRILTIAARTPMSKPSNRVESILEAARGFPTIARRLWVASTDTLTMHARNLVGRDNWSVGSQ